jgi:hypothetical protein
MIPGHLKVLLDSLVMPKDRQFDVRFVERRTQRVLGTYRRSTRMITIIRRNNHGPLDVIATGLHELAHHLTWETAQHEYRVAADGKTRCRRHGESFLAKLHTLSLAFNERYRTRLKGAMRCDRRRPGQSPFYMTPEDCLLLAIFEQPQARSLMPGYLIGPDEYDDSAMQ